MAAAITPRTKALLPVSLFGLSAPMDSILEIAGAHRLKVIEDAACAVGSFYRGHHAGTLVDAGCFSFHPRKAITTGEGGMVTTNDDAVAVRICALRDHGASTSDLVRHHGAQPYLLPEFDMLGFNYRMTDIQGAVGSAQMDRLPSVLLQRARLARRYDEALARLEWLRPPVVPDGYRHGYQAYVCLFRPQAATVRNIEALNAQRNQLMKELEAAGVATRPGTHAVHMLGYYSRKYGYQREMMPNAWFLDQLTLTLPLYAQMTDAEQDYVIEQLVTIGRKSLVRSS
jgi:dTDP-4-amino-4,6-dideoxygalactose transaminase